MTVRRPRGQGGSQPTTARQQRPPEPKTSVDTTPTAQDALSAPTGSGLERHLLASIRAAGLPEPEREFRFHATRMYRLDFAWPDVHLGVEVEGGLYRGGGHTTVTGLKRDIEKGNLLTMGGWRLLRFHGDQVRSGEAVTWIRRALEI